MKKFLNKIIVFSVLQIIIGGGIFIVFVVSINILSSDYHLKSNIKNVFTGDSHIQKAINDTKIPNSLNLGTTSESFYFTYYKLQALLNNNSSVEKVYLGFSYHSLSNYYDRFIYGEYASAIAPKYFYTLPLKEQTRMIYWNKTNLVSFTKSVIKYGLSMLRNDYSSFLGGYSNNFDETSAVNSSMDKRLLFQYYHNGRLNSFSEINIEYLNKIALLCKEKGIELYALNTPLYEYYAKKVPEKYKVKLREILNESQIDYIDLSNLGLKRAYFIPDGDHVSKLGAEVISVELNKAHTHNNVYGI